MVVYNKYYVYKYYSKYYVFSIAKHFIIERFENKSIKSQTKENLCQEKSWHVFYFFQEPLKKSSLKYQKFKQRKNLAGKELKKFNKLKKKLKSLRRNLNGKLKKDFHVSQTLKNELKA